MALTLNAEDKESKDGAKSGGGGSGVDNEACDPSEPEVKSATRARHENHHERSMKFKIVIQNRQIIKEYNPQLRRMTKIMVTISRTWLVFRHEPNEVFLPFPDRPNEPVDMRTTLKKCTCSESQLRCSIKNCNQNSTKLQLKEWHSKAHSEVSCGRSLL